MEAARLEKRNVAILVIGQTLFMVASITVMTLSGVVGQQLSPDPGLATLPIAMMMLGTVASTLPASLFMKRVGRRRGFIAGASLGGVAGGLIARFGVSPILLCGTALVANLGTGLAHFWVALVLLGIGWNFLFVGGSALLSSVHSETERGKVQGINDLTIFSLVALGSLLSGALLHRLGWEALNLAMLPLILLVALATLWLRPSTAPQPAASSSPPSEE